MSGLLVSDLRRPVADDGLTSQTARDDLVDARLRAGRRPAGYRRTAGRVTSAGGTFGPYHEGRWNVEFRVLGDLEVQHDRARRSRSARTSSARCSRSSVLHAGEVVTADRLIDALWGDEPPARAGQDGAGLRLAAAQGARRGGRTPPRMTSIVTRDHGYVLRVDPAQVDAAAFERLLAEGRPRTRRARLPRAPPSACSEALALWRGPALSDFTFDAWAARGDRAARGAAPGGARGRASTPISSSGAMRRWWPSWRRSSPSHPLREHLRGTAHARAVPLRAPVRGAGGLPATTRRVARRRARASSPARRCGRATRRSCARTLRSMRRPRSSGRSSTGDRERRRPAVGGRGRPRDAASSRRRRSR